MACANFSQSVSIITAASLAFWDISNSWKWACFVLGGVGGALGGLFFAYVFSALYD
jgi:ACS family pantothenate transporter-like MFS transporter